MVLPPSKGRSIDCENILVRGYYCKKVFLMLASVKNPTNITDENVENISVFPYRGPHSYYMPDDQETISVTSASAAFEYMEAKRSSIWPHYQEARRLLEFKMFFDYITELQSTCELLGIRSSSAYESNVPVEGKTQIAKWLEIFHLPSFHLAFMRSISDVSASLCETPVNWGSSDSPERTKEAIDRALEKGNHDLAAKLAAEGNKRFPEDTDLQKIANILAPPRVIQTSVPPTQGLRESMVWLKKHRSQYQDQWVAIQSGTLVGTAASREQLLESLEDSDTVNTIITKIP
jgi:hypothetical protein